MKTIVTRLTSLTLQELASPSLEQVNLITLQLQKVLVQTKTTTGSTAGFQMYLTTIKTGTCFLPASGLTDLQGSILIQGGVNSGQLVSAGESLKRNSCRTLTG